jgi:hypothetical protein
MPHPHPLNFARRTKFLGVNFESPFSDAWVRMVKTQERNKDTRVVAVTIRPAAGIKIRDTVALKRWLNKNCSQWEFFEEITGQDEDGETRHIHGRVMMNKTQRIDNIKRSLITGMDAQLWHPAALKRGIKWLYDDWEYLRKDLTPLYQNITDEDEWELYYADPANKYEKPKNSESWFYINLFKDKLEDHVETDQVKQLLRPFIGSNEIQVPGSQSAFENLAWRIKMVWNCHCENERDEIDNM